MWQCKGFTARRLMKEFPNKNWKRRTLEDYLRKLRTTGSIERTPGSGRPRWSQSADNVAAVDELVQSQEGKPQTHLSTRQISRELWLSQTTVMHIIHNDLRLKCLKRRRAQELTAANPDARLIRARQLLQRFSESDISFIFFTDEKIFTVNAPSNPQNDCVYVAESMSKKQVAADRLLRTRSTFSQSLMVSVGISKLGCTDIIFADPGAKVNGEYYRNVILTNNLLPAMRHICHRICSYFNRTLHPHTGHVRPSHCCRPPLLTSLDQKCGRLIHRTLIQWIIQYGPSLNNAYIRHVSKTLMNFGNVWWLSGKTWSNMWLTVLLISGDFGSEHVSVQRVDTLNTACE